MTRALAIAALAACSGRDAPPAPVIEPLPPAELVVEVGRQPIINPLNLWDLLIDGTAELDVVGVIAGQPITTKDLDDRTGQVLTRIGDRIYDARDAGWRWLIEREGLRRAAGARSIVALLADGIATLPAPDDAALAHRASDRYLWSFEPIGDLVPRHRGSDRLAPSPTGLSGARPEGPRGVEGLFRSRRTVLDPEGTATSTAASDTTQASLALGLRSGRSE